VLKDHIDEITMFYAQTF
jgi:hypothetical protein